MRCLRKYLAVTCVLFVVYMVCMNLYREPRIHMFSNKILATVNAKTPLQSWKDGLSSRTLFRKTDEVPIISESARIKKILVVAYQRSGSTFTSEILQHGEKKIFYSMEPLWQIYRTCYRQSEGICCPNNKCRSPLHPYEEINKTLSVFRSIYACNFNALPYEVLRSFSAFPSTGHEYITRLKCFRKTTKLNKNLFNSCNEKLARFCESSSVIIIKTHRIDIELAKALKDSLDNLQIIHLVRDPRSLLYRRDNVGALTNDPFNVQSKALCSLMYKNIMDATPDIHTLLYEQLVKEPERIVKRLFKFTGLNFTLMTSKWLQTNTKKSGKEESKDNISSGHIGAISSHPKHSFEVSRNWRNRILLKSNEVIQNSCKKVLNILGLRVFNGEKELRDLRIQVLKDRFNIQ